MSTTPDAQDLSAQASPVPASPVQTSSIQNNAAFRPASEDIPAAAAHVAATSGSDRVSDHELDHELDIVQPQDPAPVVAMSPLERALRTLASEKLG
jgi:hypothetical protein